MENVDRWFSGYGDVADFGGNAPDQRRMYEEGNVFLRFGPATPLGNGSAGMQLLLGDVACLASQLLSDTQAEPFIQSVADEYQHIRDVRAGKDSSILLKMSRFSIS